MMLQTCSCVAWGLDLTDRGFFYGGFYVVEADS